MLKKIDAGCVEGTAAPARQQRDSSMSLYPEEVKHFFGPFLGWEMCCHLRFLLDLSRGFIAQQLSGVFDSLSVKRRSKMCFGLMIACNKLKVNGDDREENKVTHHPFGIKQLLSKSQHIPEARKIIFHGKCAFFFAFVTHRQSICFWIFRILLSEYRSKCIIFPINYIMEWRN